MRGPPISVTCECGESRSLRYGERWRCERCGRVWNTEQIPVEEYRGLTRALRRMRFMTLGFALAALAVLVPLAIFVNEGLVLMIPLVLAMPAILLGPVWKRRVRQLVAERPRWELHPE